MNRTGKSNVLILGILAAALAVAAGVLFYMEEQERHQRLKLQQRVVQLTQDKQRLEQDLTAAQEEKARLTEDLSQAQEEARRLAARLNEISESREDLQAQLAERDVALQSLNAELEAARMQREQLNKQLASVQDQTRKLESQLAQLRKERVALETKLRTMEGGEAVELEKVVVTPEGLSTIPEPRMEVGPTGSTVVSGRVLVINRDYDFIVMNVGKANGVKLGDEFEVWRDSKKMGQVKVEKLYEALSAAALLPGTDKQALREGDTVRSVEGGSS